jgi:hypothetical protein
MRLGLKRFSRPRLPFHGWVLAGVGLALLIPSAILFGQQTFQQERARRWQQYEVEMQDPVDDPPDAWVEKEFVFARLRYRSPFDGRFRSRWGTDANKSDRLFMMGLRRLSRVDTRSVEEVVDVDSDEMFNFPWLYAVSTGTWSISPTQAARLHQFFERGGTLMTDDFHGEPEWRVFMQGIERMYPGAQAEEIENGDPIFHTVFDLSERVQISGFQIIRGIPYERNGFVPHWRAIRDSRGRIVVMACFNMDVGDAWEWSDYPPYPEKLANLAYRLGVNYVTYSLTH